MNRLFGSYQKNANGKKGSVTVQLCLILSAILLLVTTFADLSFAVASRPYAQEVMDMAGRSVLSEYDRDLKGRYGLFFFQLEKEELKELFVGYVDRSLKKSRGKTELLAMKTHKAILDTSDYSATNCDILMDQIVALMKYEVFTGSHNILDLLGKNTGGDKSGGTVIKEGVEAAGQSRKLRNGRIIQELPSTLLDGVAGGIVSSLSLPNPSNFGKIAYEEVCLNRYILTYFNHRQKYDKESFFAGEVEYILCGNFNDETNSRIIYLSLLAFRSTMNAIHIKSDSSKMELIRATALLISEGVATPAVEAGLIALWAGAEAALDVDELEKGNKVPLLKNKDQWRLSLENAMAGEITQSSNPIGQSNLASGSNEEQSGLDYEDYLFLFLCFKGRYSKLIRVMDLIHINIKGHCNKEFSYSSCSSGFAYDVEFKRDRPFLTALFLRRGEFNGCHEY